MPRGSYCNNKICRWHMTTSNYIIINNVLCCHFIYAPYDRARQIYLKVGYRGTFMCGVQTSPLIDLMFFFVKRSFKLLFFRYAEYIVYK